MTAHEPHRREQLLDIAERRFIAQGFLATSVAELIDDAGIAKGTFYHHFPSKEAVLTAVIDRQVAHLRAHADAIAADGSIPPLARALRLLGGGIPPRPGAAELAAELERSGNELMHLRALDATTRSLVVPLARILADACAAGEIACTDPEATAAALLVVTGHLIDRDLLGWMRGADHERISGLVAAAERLLGVAPGTLDPIAAALAAPAPPERRLPR